MLSIENFSLLYDENLILNNINLEIKEGSVIVVTGESGCGKSSLIRAINGIATEIYGAKVSGDIKLDNKSILQDSITERSKYISTVFQNPKTQFFCTNSTDEIAFALENRNIPREKIFEKIDFYSNLLDTKHLLDRNLYELSIGEKQLIAVNSVAIMDNKIYLFDEPSSSLDRKSINKLLNAISKLKEMGKIVIISEHRLYYLRNIMDNLCVIKNKELHIYPKDEINNGLTEKYNLRELEETKKEDLVNDKYFIKNIFDKNFDNKKDLKCLDFYCKYDKKDIFNFNLSFNKGIYFILGNNGIGKTSFVRNLCKLNKRQKGKLYINDKLIKYPEEEIAIVMQDVNYQLFTESVESEISIVTDDEEVKKKYLVELGLYDKKDRHPQSLSGGEKQRLAIALAMASNKKIIVLDEPTSGLCYKNMLIMIKLIKEMKLEGKTVLIVTHDYEFIKLSDENIIEFVK